MAAIALDTQEKLGKFVKKPALSEKLLLKPPFRFVFDIILAVIKQYGVFEGLFRPSELIFENINDKEAKKLFLEKVFKCLGTALEKEISCKPAKLIAGLEPENTNSFLQDLAFLIENKIETRDAVSFVLGGGQRPSVKPSDQKPKDDEVKVEKRQGKAEKEQIKAGKDNVKKVELASRPKAKEIQEPRTRESSRNNVKGSTKQEAVPSLGTKNDKKQDKTLVKSNAAKVPPKNSQNGKEEEKRQIVEQTKKVVGSVQAIETLGKVEKLQKDSDVAIVGSGKLEEVDEQNERVDRERRKEETGREDENRDLHETIDIVPGNEAFGKSGENSPKEGEIQQSERVPEYPWPKSTRVRARTPLPIGQTFIVEDSKPGLELEVLQRESMEEQLAALPLIRRMTGRVRNVIMSEEPLHHESEDDEDKGEIARILQLAEQDDFDAGPTIGINASSDGHGKLVDSIIATQKELVGDEAVETEEGARVAEKLERRKEREALQTCLQEMTRSLRPLLRLLESSQEDWELMRREVDEWREKRVGLEEQLVEKKRSFEESVTPLYEVVAEYEEDISCQRRKLSAIRARMFQERKSATEMLKALKLR